MNYRHAFHAGNFADLIKHAALLLLLDALPHPRWVADTHAGEGVYDLSGPDAMRSGEAVAATLIGGDLPTGLALLRAAVEKLNAGSSVRSYPGSPRLIADRQTKADQLLLIELAPKACAALRRNLAGVANTQIVQDDGFEAVIRGCPVRGTALVIIDPPFEQPDDYARAADVLGKIAGRNRDATVMVWLPLKDLETFDRFLRSLEGIYRGPMRVVEVRLRPLTDPMKMNGCALVLIGVPEPVMLPLQSTAEWVAARFGSPGEARVWSLGG